MAAMTSKFYYVCVIQYYSDQWSPRMSHHIGQISRGVLTRGFVDDVTPLPFLTRRYKTRFVGQWIGNRPEICQQTIWSVDSGQNGLNMPLIILTNGQLEPSFISGIFYTHFNKYT